MFLGQCDRKSLIGLDEVQRVVLRISTRKEIYVKIQYPIFFFSWKLHKVLLGIMKRIEKAVINVMCRVKS